MGDDDREDEVFEARATGKSARAVAREFGLTPEQVERITTERIDELHSGDGLRRSVGFALHRLELMEMKFYARAMEGDGDCACAAIALKSNERRASLSGSGAPVGYAVRLMGAAAPPELTSTQSLLRELDALRCISPRERELTDRERYDDAPLTEDEQAELATLQAESKAKREAA